MKRGRIVLSLTETERLNLLAAIGAWFEDHAYDEPNNGERRYAKIEEKLRGQLRTQEDRISIINAATKILKEKK